MNMKLDLSNLEARALAATEGPWETSVLLGENSPKEWAICGPEGGDMLADLSGCPNEEANARFIEAANPAAVLELIQRIRDLESRPPLPGIMMQDLLEIVDDYDVPEDVPEWQWIKDNASHGHVANGKWNGVWEFTLNLSRDFDNVPERLQPVIERSRTMGAAYILFYQ